MIGIECSTCQGFHGLAHGLLHEMIAPCIAARINTGMTGKAQKAGMLARAIVVQLVWFAACPRLRNQHILLKAPVAPAFEIIFGQACRCNHPAGKRRMGRLARVGGAGKRQLFLAKSVTVCRSAFDERQGLHGFDGRAGKNRCFHVPERHDLNAVTVINGNKTAVTAFDATAPCDFDQNRIGHRPFPTACLIGPRHARCRQQRQARAGGRLTPFSLPSHTRKIRPDIQSVASTGP